MLHVEPVHAAGHFLYRAEAHFGHDRAQFFGDEEEIVDHMFGLTGKARAQHRVLRRDADRAGVEMAFAHHDAACGDQRCGGKAELVRAQQRADRNIAAGAQAAIDLHRDAAAQIVEQQRLLGFGQTDFPRRTRMGQRGQGRCTGAAFIAGNRDMVGARLGYACGHRADADFGHQLDRNPRGRVDVLQIVDQLRQILDRIDVMVRRGRDQADTRGRVAGGADGLVDLVAGQLAAFAGLRTLRHLDLDVVGIDQIFGGHAKAARRNLLDRRTHRIAVGHRLEAFRVFAAFAGVRFAADAVHRDRQRGVRFPADRAIAHRAGGKALDDFDRRFDFVKYRAACQQASTPSGHEWSATARSVR